MKSLHIRFVIITVPRGIAFRKLSSIIQLIKDVGDTYTAATYPPHVTLRTGAIVPAAEVDAFIDRFEEHIGAWQSFSIETAGISTEEFVTEERPSFFVYYRIKPNPDLEKLNRHLLQFEPYIKSQKKDFHPHLSLAYNDLSRSGHERIRQLLKTKGHLFPESISWTCDTVSLYYFKEGKWLPFYSFKSSDAEPLEN